MLMIANNSLVLIKISLSYGTHENKSLSTDKDELQIHCDGFGPHHLGEDQLHPNSQLIQKGARRWSCGWS